MAIQRNMDPKKCPMPSQDPNVRNKNFEEVALGYTYEMAVNEARRCLNCKNMPCVSGCPVGVKIPSFIDCIKKGEFAKAYSVIRETNSLPAICGRVCPQENQCEKHCVRGVKGESVAIGRLERFAADEGMRAQVAPPAIQENGKRVAVIGSGPAGLSCAGALRQKGYAVDVFEALHTPGGVLVYGIPEFRLPKALVEKEIEGFPIMDALSDFSFYQTGAVGLPIPAVNHIDPFIEAHVPNLWTYYCCGQYKAVTNMFIAMPSWRNRILGWQLFKYDIAGFLQWGFNFYNSQVSYYPIDPYSTTDSDGAFPAGDPFQVYPGADGAPEESIRIMVTLHSLCDLRALRLLEQLKGREAALEIVKDITFTEYPKNLDGILDMRDRVNAAIEASL